MSNTDVMLGLLNAVRANQDGDYTSFIPEATRNNIAAIGNMFDTYSSAANTFLGALPNLIGKIMSSNFTGYDPFDVFDKGRFEYGDTLEKIYIQKIAAQAPPTLVNGGTVDPFKINKPTITATFARVDRALQYPVTLPRTELRKAFYDSAKMDEFLRLILDTPFQSFKDDAFTMGKEVCGLFEMYPNNGTSSVDPTAVTNAVNVTVKTSGTPAAIDITATAENLLTQLKMYSDAISFNSSDNNRMGVRTRTAKENQVLIIDYQWANYMDVKVLTGIFQLAKANTGINQVILVDALPQTNIPGLVAVLCDRTKMERWNYVIGEMDSIYNPAGRYWNWYYYWEGLMAYDPTGNAIPFVVKE